MKRIFFYILMISAILSSYAEDGSRLWLRMSMNSKPAVVKSAKSKTLNIARAELANYWHDGRKVELKIFKSSDKSSDRDNTCTERDGYTLTFCPKSVIVSSQSEVGILYGTYALLRMQETGNVPSEYQLSSSPDYAMRVLNHWDNPNGTIERGFAGQSIFWPSDTSAVKFGSKAYCQSLSDYARANASIGINVTVVNNVNAKPLMLSEEKIAQVKLIADLLRPWGVRVMIAVNFASPKALGDIKTADPLDKDVINWWHNKCKEIYQSIPDFAGFLVKANSEGEPGPMDYHRTHVDGANMLADALTDAYQQTSISRSTYMPVVMWRAFVYSATGSDRASQAYNEFVPYDGQFRDNVIIQIKNGPIDFQPREAVSPLFFGLKKTRMMPEFQITQEYTGESIHTCFLASMWKEFFDATASVKLNPVTPTYKTSSIANHPLSAIAGVANIGDSTDWCGSTMAQANWYAFGRMTWNSHLTAQQIAREWIRQTFDIPHDSTETPLIRLLSTSRETVVHYMMPLGLHHIFAAGHHYGPEPWCNPDGWREDWKPVFYHKADSLGIGFNRTMTGSGNVCQYPDSLAHIYNDINLCPEQLLLWFHHASWNHTMHSGETLWDALCHTYDLGVREASAYPAIWQQLKPYIDNERFMVQKNLFERQVRDAWWWRDACLLYFQQFSRQPFPIDSPAPRHDLKTLINYHLDMDNYTRADITKLP